MSVTFVVSFRIVCHIQVPEDVLYPDPGGCVIFRSRRVCPIQIPEGMSYPDPGGCVLSKSISVFDVLPDAVLVCPFHILINLLPKHQTLETRIAISHHIRLRKKFVPLLHSLKSFAASPTFSDKIFLTEFLIMHCLH